MRTGVAFPLIKRLLQLNGSSADDQPVEVVLLSRNDPDTGLRVFKSIEHYGLNISRAVFVAGSNPFPYMEAFNASLFLSGNPKDVTEAVERGCPAGCIYPTDFIDDDEDEELRIAFDFDGIIADDSAETVFQEGGELKLFHDHERTLADEPLPPGPLLRFFTDIANLQKREIERNERDASYKPKIRVAIATARNAPAHERVITTLRKLDIRVDEAFFLRESRRAGCCVSSSRIFSSTIRWDISKAWPASCRRCTCRSALQMGEAAKHGAPYDEEYDTSLTGKE